MLKKVVFLLISISSFLLFLAPFKADAGIDIKQQYQDGPFFQNGAPVGPLIVEDDKYTAAVANTFDWTTLNNIEARDVVSLRIKDGVYIGTLAFSYTVTLHVDYYTSPSSGPTSLPNFTLTVNYDPAHGTTYKGLDTHEFTGAYKIVTTIVSGTQTPSGSGVDYSSFLVLCNRITVNRRYNNFNLAAPVGPAVSPIASKQLSLTWTSVTGAEEYDVEWTTINNGNPGYVLVDRKYQNSGPVDDGNLITTLNQIFRNNSSRITTADNTCTLSTMFTDNYMLIRIRAVRYLANGLREAGNWDYKQNNGSTFNIIPITWNDPYMNWQYSSAFAEEGKKKEVINYFDGSLRGRQTVTINNSDNVAVAQQNIYDDFGRVVANVLPAPVQNTGTGAPALNYISNLNKNTSNAPYSFADIAGTVGTNCEIAPGAMSTSSGAAQYYSSANWLIQPGNPAPKSYNAYIPDAGANLNAPKYPFSVTQYTPDNTGRIKIQGGVGPQFQPGTAAVAGQNSNTTKYYYGKPEQWELDQLFGNDVGYAEHYLKNMVVDPNGQISISYINASGKTIATALAGDPPASLSALDSYASPTVNNDPTESTSTTQQHIHLLKADQFTYDGTALKLSAHTTYLAAAIDPNAQLTFDIQKLTDCYPNTTSFSPCVSCFYKMTVNVNNECGQSVLLTPYTANVQLGSAAPTTLTVPINQPGEYYVDIEFAFDPNVITTNTDNFITAGIANGYIQSQFDFIANNYLNSLDVSGCYSDCHTCQTLLADPSVNPAARAAFEQIVINKCLAMKLDPTAVNSASFKALIDAKYLVLENKCTALQANCKFNTCDAVQSSMEADVSPGGQYALFDSNNQPLETATNVLANNFARIRTLSDRVTRADGTEIAVSDASFSLQDMVQYWQPSWAAVFLPFHPESCQLDFCHQVNDFKSWDQLLQQYINTAADVTGIPNGGTAWSPGNANDWLVNEDPFFNTVNGVTGPGATTAIRNAMLADLQSYSTNVLNFPSGTPSKSLMQYNDFVLYCKNASGNTNSAAPTSDYWLNCSPVAACRVPDREWTSYRDMYLELKAKYYKQLQDAQCGANCPVGQPIVNNVRSATTSVTGGSGTPAYIVHIADSFGTSGGTDYNGYSYTMSTLSVWLTDANNVPVNALHNLEVDFDYSTDQPQLNSGGSDKIPGGITILQGHSFASFDYLAIHTDDFRPGGGIVTTSIAFSCVTSVPDGITVDGPSCPDGTGCAGKYANKTSRFPVTQNGDFPSGPVDQSVAAAMSTQGNADIAAQAADICTGKAEMWMDVLAPGLAPGLANGTYTQTQIDGLKARLIEVCSAGGDATHPMGASDLAGDATPGTSLYSSFGAAIKGELNLTNFTSELNPWLIASPAPYTVKPQMVAHTVSNSNTAICNLLNTLWNQLPAGSSNTALFNYMTSTFGAAMTLSQDDVNTLVSGCSNCKFILAKDVTLPVFLDPAAAVVSSSLPYPGAISQTDYSNAKSALLTQIPGLTSSDPNYGEILSNYMNLKFGFSLTADNYQDFEVAPSGTILLNQTPFRPVTPDPNACVNEALETAINAGLNAYSAYIAAQRQLFRASYISTCSAAQAYANLDIAQKAYHYTLYYYDQADNLVRTVPPEGVHLITGAALNQVTLSRQMSNITSGSNTTCTLNAQRIKLNDKAGALTQLSTTLSAKGPVAIEMWLYNTASGISQVTEVSSDYKWLFNTAISNNVIGVDIYPMVGTTTGVTPASAVFNHTSMHYRATIPGSMMPLTPWTHLVIQGQNGIAQGTMPEIWIDGVQLIVTKGNSALNAPWTVKATTSGMQYPDIMPTLQDIRFYNSRVLNNTQNTEIATNANNACLMPLVDNDNDNLWYAFNLPGGATVPPTIASTGGNGTGLQPAYPSHTLKTNYAYNSTNQVVMQNSPDGGTNRYWYDLLSRLFASQNDKQQPDSKFSYTTYDGLGRINEVGQKAITVNNLTSPYNVYPYNALTTVLPYTGTMNNTTPSLPDYLGDNAYFMKSGSNEQITNTWYDAMQTGVAGLLTNLPQNNLRKRVAVSAFSPNPTTGVTQATYYNYDIDGNVSTLWQQIAGLGTKKIDYEFDLVSGKVNFVKYQDGQPDHFYYKYDYDAENRITDAWSGTQVLYDSYSNTSRLLRDNQKLDAHYYYYLHGPLARVELGDELTKVQGIDYAYTLQGWLKGVNGSSLGADINADGPYLGNIAKDAYAYSLGYYNGDYTPISGSAGAFNLNYQANANDNTGQNLYNGNISNATMAISSVSSGAPVGYSYHYDQLSRIKTVIQNSGTLGAGWNNNALAGTTTPTGAYAESFSYDANGNITAATRYANHGQMDDLHYQYTLDGNGYKTSNKLNYVIDNTDDGVTTTDLKTQGAGNYSYDATGNLTSDAQAGISNIGWTVYGKIQSITGNNNITYAYNPAGQRVSKLAGTLATYYVRDAQGNTLALYDAPVSSGTVGTLTWREQDMYGSKRLGQWHPNLSMATGATTTATDAQWQTWGLKEYELDNHLGNVMATINDRRIQVPNGNNLDHFEADVVNAQDYFAFGMQQPGRIYTANPTAYRYGFNGQEKSLEIDANGNHNTALFWEYDTRLGRRWDLDPKPNPGVSSYSAFNNNPINNNDLLGDTISNRSDWSRAGASVFVNLYLNAIKGRSDPNRNCNMCCLNAIASNLSVLYGTEMQVAKSYSLAMEGVGKIGYRGDREYAEPTLNGKVAYSNSSKADMEGSGFNSGVVDNIMHQMKGHKGQFVFGVGIGEEYHSTLVVAYNNGQKLSQGNKEVIASEDNPIFVFVEDYGGARVMTGQELETVMKSYVEGAALYYSGRRDLGSGPLKLKDPNKPRPLTTHVDNLEAVPTTNQQPATDNQPPQQ